MELTVTNTSKLVELEPKKSGAVQCRIWEGKLADGSPFHMFVARVAVHDDAPAEVHERFATELKEVSDPSPDVKAYDLRYFVP